MNAVKREKSPYRQLIYRPFWITVTGLLIILTLALAVLINSSWRALYRTAPLKEHLALIEEIQHYSAELDRLAPTFKTAPSEKLAAQLAQLDEALKNTLKTSQILSDEARSALSHVVGTLQGLEEGSTGGLSSVNMDMRTALHAEVNTQNRLLNLLARDNRLELEIGTFIAVTLTLLGLLMLFFLRHRILRPLDDLSLLITRLGRQALPPVPLDEVDPLLKPLFLDFNRFVQRLSELELAQQKHRQELESRVRDATQSLLEYQHTLAQSERMAAVGELTAGLAHELRNPLAGIRLALDNLSNEIDDSDKVSRLALVIGELDRVTRLLNQVLDQSRHSPESASRFNLAGMLDSLLQLVRYQIPPTIVIEQAVPRHIQCHLPQGRLRQAMLNLILNAAQSIGEARGVITIEAETGRDRLSIRICDSGRGFPKKLLEDGIQPFSTGREHGTGLGLAIVRRFCYEQGGDLTLANPASGGACAEMLLPWKP